MLLAVADRNTSVSQILQIIRSNDPNKVLKGTEENENERNANFPWMSHFSNSCKEAISKPSILKLDGLMCDFLK